MTAVVEAFQAATERLAADAERQVLAIYAALEAGRIDRETASLLIAAIVNRANASATTTADAWLVAQIEAAAGAPTAAVGVAPVDDSERLVLAAQTVLADTAADVPMRLARLARGETFDTAQRAAHDAMQKHRPVEGWVRQLDGDPCQLCVWWSRNGRVWPKAHPFQRHKGCNCQPRVVLAQGIKSTGYTRQLERNAP